LLARAVVAKLRDDRPRQPAFGLSATAKLAALDCQPCESGRIAAGGARCPPGGRIFRSWRPSSRTISLIRCGPSGSTPKGRQFRLTLGDGTLADLRGRVVHCRFEARTRIPGFYVTGFEFITDDAEREAAVGGLIEKIR
jgi:hypothetical protein